MDLLKTVSRQTSYQVIGKIISALTGLFVLSLIVRNYGSEGAGIFTLTLTYLTFFGVLADFGFNADRMSELLGDSSQFIRKLLGLRIVLSSGLTILVLIITPLLPISDPNFKLSVFYGSLIILLNGLFDTPSGFFQSRQRYDLSVISYSLGTILATLLALVLISLHVQIFYLITSELIGWILCVILAFLFLRRLVSQLSPIFNLDFFKTTLTSSWPIALTLILNLVYFRADSFIISAIKSVSETGLYNLAYSFFQTALVLPTFIMNSYYPLMLKLLSESRSLFLTQLKKALLIMGGLGLLGTTITWAISPTLIKLVFGLGFDGSARSLQILSLSFPAFFLSSILMWVLVSLKEYKVMLLIYVTGLVVNVLLNLIFISQYSYIAASWITGVSEYLILLLQLLILSRYEFSH